MLPVRRSGASACDWRGAGAKALKDPVGYPGAVADAVAPGGVQSSSGCARRPPANCPALIAAGPLVTDQPADPAPGARGQAQEEPRYLQRGGLPGLSRRAGRHTSPDAAASSTQRTPRGASCGRSTPKSAPCRTPSMCLSAVMSAIRPTACHAASTATTNRIGIAACIPVPSGSAGSPDLVHSCGAPSFRRNSFMTQKRTTGRGHRRSKSVVPG